MEALLTSDGSHMVSVQQPRSERLTHVVKGDPLMKGQQDGWGTRERMAS